MTKILIVGLGGFIGAIARYSISGWITKATQSSMFPYGTLLVNVVGCLLLGVIMTLVQDGRVFTPQVRLFLTVGILGSLTTFSTFGYETLELLSSQNYKLFYLNIAGNLLLGLGAVMAGRALVKLISS